MYKIIDMPDNFYEEIETFVDIDCSEEGGLYEPKTLDVIFTVDNPVMIPISKEVFNSGCFSAYKQIGNFYVDIEGSAELLEVKNGFAYYNVEVN